MSETSLPSNIDFPSPKFFPVGVAIIETPYEGGSAYLEIVKQDFVSYDRTFPGKGSNHPSKTAFSWFHTGAPTHVGGGILRATCFFARIGKTHKQEFKQSVQFYGVRHRNVKFREQYEKEARVPVRTPFVNSDGTRRMQTNIVTTNVTTSRDIEAFNIVAREPFSELVTCFRHTYFQNFADKTEVAVKQKLQVKDKNDSNWREQIEQAYQRQKHEASTGFTTPQPPSGFLSQIASNYLSETSSPSLTWYNSKIGNDDYIVTPTSVESYFAGHLRKIEWVTTQYL
jgi:hypothetical protein